MRKGSRAGERGAATAELTMVLPVLVALTLGLVWLLAVGIDQARTVDAARETARAVARGDDEASALARGRRVGPAGTVVVVGRSGGDVVATATATVAGPGGLLRFLGGAHLSAQAVAAEESP